MMKFKWTLLIGIAVIIGAVYWAIDSTRIRTYTGAELSFPLGSGLVTIVNTGEEPVPMRLLATGTRGNFTADSTTEGIGGSSTREGTGRNVNHILDIEIPAGQHDLQITRGSNVTFTLSGARSLDVTVNPLSDNDSRSTLLIAAVLVLGALAYMSHVTEHGWLKLLRRRGASGAIGTVESTGAAGS